MKKGDKASPIIILAVGGLLLKILITLEPHGIFVSKYFVYLCILTSSSNWYEIGDKASPSIISAGQAL